MPPEALPVRLPKGLEIRVRPIGPDDKDLLQLGIERLGEEGSFYRFHRIVRSLSSAELAYLTELDQRDHAAWGAAIEGPDGELVPAGVARYIRLDDHLAEAAVTVLDDFRQQGIGSLLLQLLSRTAMANGITRFEGNVMSENHRMLSVFHHLGAVVVPGSGSEATVVLDLPFTKEWAGGLADEVHAHFADDDGRITP